VNDISILGSDWGAMITLMASGPGVASFCLLLAMSLLCWYKVLIRIVVLLCRYRTNHKYIHAFSNCSRQQLLQLIDELPQSGLKHMTKIAVYSWVQTSPLALSTEERSNWVKTAISQVIEAQRLQMESGLTQLACIGVCAPFVGLFGTVMGIVDALQSISASGQSTIDKVAGPVGEALVMTGFGLAVAVPAVLFYNAFVRINRKEQYKTDAFATRLHALLCRDLELKDLIDDVDVCEMNFAGERR